MTANLKPSPSSLGLLKLEEELTCPVCLDHYTNPKTLPCLHSFCQHCLEGLPLDKKNETYYLSCPTCRHCTELPEEGVGAFPVAFHLNHLKDVHSLMKKTKNLSNSRLEVAAATCSDHGKPLEFFYTKIGRGNAIYLGLWLGWIGTLLFAIGCCLQYHSCDTTALIGSRTRRQHRSAFTYWGEEPSRMDLAKESSSNFVVQFKDGYEKNAEYVIWLFGNFTSLLVVVPLFELVILPLFPKLEYFITNPLKGLGLSNILIILSILSLFLIDLIGRIDSSNISEMPCFFIWRPINQKIDISYWILLIPSVLAGASYFLSGIYLFEFLCSQSPFGMHGMIIGLHWFLHGIFIDIGSGILLIVYYHPIHSVSFMSCTSWLSVIFGVIAVIGLVVYVLIARWYVNRVRDTDLVLHAAVEEHWEHMLTKENDTINDISTESFVISSYK
uniref:RING-type domain-containing protein n=1 Tax=Amphimedon queenslandica TaxID=400682 RepID=A0A1X7TIU2_AMPQE